MSYALLGLVLIGVTIAMIVIARPGDGVSAPFLKSWPVGQVYALAAMGSGITGVALVISDWPF